MKFRNSSAGIDLLGSGYEHAVMATPLIRIASTSLKGACDDDDYPEHPEWSEIARSLFYSGRTAEVLAQVGLMSKVRVLPTRGTYCGHRITVTDDIDTVVLTEKPSNEEPPVWTLTVSANSCSGADRLLTLMSLLTFK